MHHEPYEIHWDRKSGIWTLWVERLPHLRAEASSLEEAKQLLADRIMDAGEAHPLLDFDPPLPLEERQIPFQNPEIYVLGAIDATFVSEPPDPEDPTDWDRRAGERAASRDAARQWRQSFFTGPICPGCGKERGERSDRKLKITAMDSGSDSASGELGEGGRSIHLFSGQFLALLSPAELSHLQFREVEFIGRRSARSPKFFELIGPPGPRNVAVKGRSPKGWRCPACGNSAFGYVPADEIIAYVAAADLPKNNSGVFTMSSGMEIELCVTGDRWRSMRGKKGTRNMGPIRVGVVPDDLVEREPQLPTLDEVRRKWPGR